MEVSTPAPSIQGPLNHKSRTETPESFFPKQPQTDDLKIPRATSSESHSTPTTHASSNKSNVNTTAHTHHEHETSVPPTIVEQKMASSRQREAAPLLETPTTSDDTTDSIEELNQELKKMQQTLQNKKLKKKSKIKLINLQIATLHNTLGTAYSERSSHNLDANYENTLRHFHNSLQIREKILGKKHPETLATYNNIGSYHFQNSEYDAALKYYKLGMPHKFGSLKNTVKIWKVTHKRQRRKSSNGDIDHALSRTFSNIGSVYFQKASYKKALEYYTGSLSLQHIENKDSAATNSEKQLSLATTYSNIASVYSKVDDQRMALEFHKKAVQIRQEELGEHVDTATSYYEIGSIYSQYDQHDKALEAYQQSLDIRKNVLDENDIQLAESFHGVGKANYSLENYEAAIQNYVSALEIEEDIYESLLPSYGMTCNNVGTAYYKLGDYDNALVYYMKALPVKEKRLGAKHKEMYSIYSNIGAAYWRKKDLDNARIWFQKACEVDRERFIRDHHLGRRALNTLSNQTQGVNNEKNTMGPGGIIDIDVIMENQNGSTIEAGSERTPHPQGQKHNRSDHDASQSSALDLFDGESTIATMEEAKRRAKQNLATDADGDEVSAVTDQLSNPGGDDDKAIGTGSNSEEDEANDSKAFATSKKKSKRDDDGILEKRRDTLARDDTLRLSNTSKAAATRAQRSGNGNRKSGTLPDRVKRRPKTSSDLAGRNGVVTRRSQLTSSTTTVNRRPKTTSGSLGSKGAVARRSELTKRSALNKRPNTSSSSMGARGTTGRGREVTSRSNLSRRPKTSSDTVGRRGTRSRGREVASRNSHRTKRKSLSPGRLLTPIDEDEFFDSSHMIVRNRVRGTQITRSLSPVCTRPIYRRLYDQALYRERPNRTDVLKEEIHGEYKFRSHSTGRATWRWRPQEGSVFDRLYQQSLERQLEGRRRRQQIEDAHAKMKKDGTRRNFSSSHHMYVRSPMRGRSRRRARSLSPIPSVFQRLYDQALYRERPDRSAVFKDEMQGEYKFRSHSTGRSTWRWTPRDGYASGSVFDRLYQLSLERQLDGKRRRKEIEELLSLSKRSFLPYEELKLQRQWMKIKRERMFEHRNDPKIRLSSAESLYQRLQQQKKRVENKKLKLRKDREERELKWYNDHQRKISIDDAVKLYYRDTYLSRSRSRGRGNVQDVNSMI
ncbi:hypothetical protein CTEN210_17812 [Chaetoceros tenuissimus]|uniref:Uncharacterized protein n=1 Tax=Chaetoceros tenuissimus TaxID=426638 RepID=A0AAD3HFF9_9STRA|nr:hypothetical protein CTEN210_17812 [Chaetoceros tenuissimus]